jgi:hypothetical protein
MCVAHDRLLHFSSKNAPTLWPLYLHMYGKKKKDVLTNNRERKPKAETKTQSFVFSDKERAGPDALDGKNFITTKKQQMLPT